MRLTATDGANDGASSGEDSSYDEGGSGDDSYEGDSGDDSSSTVDATRAIDLGEHSAWHNKKITKHACAPLKNGGLVWYMTRWTSCSTTFWLSQQVPINSELKVTVGT